MSFLEYCSNFLSSWTTLPVKSFWRVSYLLEIDSISSLYSFTTPWRDSTLSKVFSSMFSESDKTFFDKLLILERTSSSSSLTSSSVFNFVSTKRLLYLGISCSVKSFTLSLRFSIVSLYEWIAAFIFSSVFTSVSAKNFLYLGSSSSIRWFTVLLISLVVVLKSFFSPDITFSLIDWTSVKAVVTSLLTSTLIESKLFSILSLNFTNLSSTLTSDSATSFLYFGTSTLRKLSTVLDKFSKFSFISSTALLLIDETF